MSGPLYVRPIIELNDFLPIFVSASLILIFGAFYAGIVTLVKMQKLKKLYMFLAYFFWILQIYCTYFLTMKIHSQPFTVKAMMIAMFAYLMVPHIYYYLITKSEERYEK
ncbi:MAG: hypothetical protein GXP61_06700 [Epsilonproteobacteria bacterium]|nr:hypothetical protein [Campylobacterota bacterium]